MFSPKLVSAQEDASLGRKERVFVSCLWLPCSCLPRLCFDAYAIHLLLLLLLVVLLELLKLLYLYYISIDGIIETCILVKNSCTSTTIVFFNSLDKRMGEHFSHFPKVFVSFFLLY